MRLNGSQYTDVAEQEGSDYASLVQLDRSEYIEVRRPDPALILIARRSGRIPGRGFGW
jgi:hypothetical protein